MKADAQDALQKEATLDEILDALRARLGKEQEQLCHLLSKAIGEASDKEKFKNVEVANKGRSGIDSGKNNRKIYRWIKVNLNNNIYWLTLFYNEVDEITRNIHTQFGRIQFWGNIEEKKGPNTKRTCADTSKWCFCPENSSDPSKYDEVPDGQKQIQTTIDREGYDSERIVAAFLRFLVKMEERMENTINVENLAKLIAKVQGDAEKLECLQESLDSFCAYAQSIYISEQWLKLYNSKNVPAKESYADKVKTFEHKRTACHDAALSAVEALNRWASEYSIPAIYAGEVSKARPTRTVVADAILEYVALVLRERRTGK